MESESVLESTVTMGRSSLGLYTTQKIKIWWLHEFDACAHDGLGEVGKAAANVIDEDFKQC